MVQQVVNATWPAWPTDINWITLRAVGGIAVLKVSYAAVIALPIVASNSLLAGALGLSSWEIALVYFSSVTLACANLLYDIFCPAILKRFNSPNDLYHKMLEIRALSKEQYPEDNFEASLQHCKDAFSSAKAASPNWGRMTRLFFFLALAGYGAIFLKRTLMVVL